MIPYTLKTLERYFPGLIENIQVCGPRSGFATKSVLQNIHALRVVIHTPLLLNMCFEAHSQDKLYCHLTCGSRLKSCETVPTVAAVRNFCRFRRVPKVQPAEDTQTMTHARSTISLVVRVISQSKNNFYDVIRLKKKMKVCIFQKKRSRLVWRKSNKMADK